MSPLSMRGFSVDLRAFIGGRKLRNTPRFGPQSAAGSRSLPPWLKNEEEDSTTASGVPALANHGIAMSSPVITTNGAAANGDDDGHDINTVSLRGPSLGIGAVMGMAPISEERTTTGTFGSESGPNTTVASLPSKESV